MFEADEFEFGVDLETKAVYQIHFLNLVDRVDDLKKAKNLARSLYRYEKYWLPLAAEYPDECLSAPIDIEWIWHCHMLSPRAYTKDCTAIVNMVINHAIKDLSEYKDAMERSQELWEKRYHEDREPFYVDFDRPFHTEIVSDFSSKISYNIIEAAMRQKDFLYQVSLPHYRDCKFLKSALLRYKKFLFLKQQLPGEFIVPCYDIDLIWHTHQLHPVEYQVDTVKYLGSLFNHDDTVTDRSEGSKLYNADVKTREHWKSFFNEGFATFGAMYRGKPPAGVLYKLHAKEIYKMTTKKTTVHFEQMILHVQSQRRLRQFKLIISTLGKTDEPAMTFKRPPISSSESANIVWNKSDLNKTGSLTFDTRDSSNLQFLLTETVKRPFPCCGRSVKLGENMFFFRPLVENADDEEQFDMQMALSSAYQLTIKGVFSGMKPGPILLNLEQGVYETASIPEDIQSLWGPVALERLPAGKDNHCEVATHR